LTKLKLLDLINTNIIRVSRNVLRLLYFSHVNTDDTAPTT